MRDLINSLLRGSVLLGAESKAARCYYKPANERLLVVTGNNATGKSIFRRALSQKAREQGLQVMHFSAEQRAQGGLARAVIYGSEEDASTGANTARMIIKALENGKMRDDPHLIIFDEPEHGLSDEYAAGAGRKVAEFCQAEAGQTKLVVVISHRQSLLRELSSAEPSHLQFGEDVSFRDWLEREIIPLDLEELLEADKYMFGRISAARRQAREQAPKK